MQVLRSREWDKEQTGDALQSAAGPAGWSWGQRKLGSGEGQHLSLAGRPATTGLPGLEQLLRELPAEPTATVLLKWYSPHFVFAESRSHQPAAQGSRLRGQWPHHPRSQAFSFKMLSQFGTPRTRNVEAGV